MVISAALTSAASASDSTWTQSSWSDGAGHSAWSDTAGFSSSFNVVTSEADEVTLGQTMADGTGDDGAITVSGSGDTDLSTTNLIAGRTCADGGDAVRYSLSGSAAKGSSSLTLSKDPSSGCLAVGDEILVIDLQGGDSAAGSSTRTCRRSRT